MPMRIAIIDDDRSVRKALRRLLAASGYEIDLFASAGEFLAQRVTALDCVISDLKMPGMGGLDLLQSLKDRHVKIPVIIITAFDTPQSRADCEKAGASAFLCKPIEEKVLLSTIRAAVESAQPQLPNRNVIL
jgi:FixJ family two-component response regulator